MSRRLPLRVAIMQPYFYPHAGYFRLMAASDIFVILDDVQFPRRGRVHRCAMPTPAGRPSWLTLPLARQPRDILIRDLAFAAEARRMLDKRLQAWPMLARPATPLAQRVRDHLFGPLGSVGKFLEDGLRVVADGLDLPARIAHSSSFALDPKLRGQARIIGLMHAIGGHTYVNAAGGTALYDAEVFRQAALDLRFLTPYRGRFSHILPALIAEDNVAIRQDIFETTGFA